MTGLLIALIFVALGVGIAVGTRLRPALSHPAGGESSADAGAPSGSGSPPASPPPGTASPDAGPRPAAASPSSAAPPSSAAAPDSGAPPSATSPDAGTPPAAGTDRADRVLSAVWRLQCLDLERSRRREAGLSTAAGTNEGPIGLAQAVEEEIAQTREEIGTPGTFRSDLEVEPDPARALLLLRSVQSTLDFVARRSQAFDLHLHPSDGALAVTVVCDDFEGDVPASGTAGDTPDATAMAEVIASAGGALAFDRDADGRMRAQLRVEVV